jgi:hypothetical protein
MLIDTSFDFRTDTPPGKDPDERSPTLRRYHRLLWSKPLPNGKLFDLSEGSRGMLHHRSDLGEFVLSSDAMIPDFKRWKSLKHITRLLNEEEQEAFIAITYTIGGMIVFPGKRINRGMTINGARGCNNKISDRFDLTLECIRRHYLGQLSPLGNTLASYRDFFALFENFKG